MQTTSTNPIPSGIEHVAEGIAALHYIDLRTQGRGTNDHIFASIPPDDPAYVTGNISGMVILHFLLPVLLPVIGVCIGVILAVGAAPFVGICFVAHLINPVVFAITCVISGLIYWKYVCWRFVAVRVIGGLFKNFF